MKGLEALERAAAEKVARAARERRPVLIRFNNDADGVCAGLSVRRAVSALLESGNVPRDESRRLLKDYQNNGAVYETGSASGDVLLLRGASEKRPLVILVDFGANAESVPGLAVARNEGCEIVVIDHHPHAPEAARLIDALVSPWLVEGGGSDYSAGLVSGEVAKKIYPVDVEELQRIALAGDKSRLIPPTPGLLKKALALDYLCDTAQPRNSLAKCEALLSDPAKLAEAHSQAAEKIGAVAAQAKGNAKVRELQNGYVVVILDIARLKRTGRFPRDGKIATVVHDSFSAGEKRPLVTLGKAKDAASFRANAAARAAGFSAPKIIDELKRELPDAITAGGGHDAAASVHAKKGLGKIVFDEAYKKLEALKAGGG